MEWVQSVPVWVIFEQHTGTLQAIQYYKKLENLKW